MENKWIFGLCFLIILAFATFNSSGVAVTKNCSSSQRATIETAATVSIWAFFLIYQGPGHESFESLQFIGFIIIVIGTLVYNELIEIPFCGLNKNTRAARAKQLLRSGDPNVKKSRALL